MYAPSTHTPGDRLVQQVKRDRITDFRLPVCYMLYFKGHSTSCAREHKPCIGLSPPHYIMPYVKIEILNVTVRD